MVEQSEVWIVQRAEVWGNVLPADHRERHGHDPARAPRGRDRPAAPGGAGRRRADRGRGARRRGRRRALGRPVPRRRSGDQRSVPPRRADARAARAPGGAPSPPACDEFPAWAQSSRSTSREGGSHRLEARPMTTATGETTQVHEVEIRATPYEIWTALTSSEWTHRYGYGGSVEYDLRPGGVYRAFATAEMLAAGAPEVVVEGEVVDADAPYRLVQTWHALFDPSLAAEPAGRVSFRLRPLANRATRLSVTHELAGAPATAAIVGGRVPALGVGWRSVLDELKRVLEVDPALAA